MAMLDIIVPHYDEPWSEGKKLFDMLALQRDVDFSQIRVILVNDGEDNDIYPEVVRQHYPYAVDWIIIPHTGVSAARNRGLEHASATWVMFCDFDDTFTSIYSLRTVFDCLDTERHDMLWYQFYVELNEQAKRQIRKQFNWVFIHGKVFRRTFLRTHGIRFPEELFYSEDTAFCRVVEMEIDPERVGEIRSEIIPYVWVYRMFSATTDPGRVYKNAVGLFRRQRYVAEQHKIRSQTELHDAVCLRAMCDAYITLNRKDFTCDRSEFEKEVLEFWEEKRKAVNVTVGVMETAYAASLKENGVDGSFLPGDRTFLDWLCQIAADRALLG